MDSSSFGMVSKTSGLVTLLFALGACSTYRFEVARLPGDRYDVDRLREALAASEEEELVERTWIPLIYLSVTSFAESSPDWPSGHHLFQGTAVGPFFFIGVDEDRYYDASGERFETWNRWGVGWGLVRSRTTRSVTGRGLRFERGIDFLWGVFGNDVVRYEPLVPEPSLPLPEDEDTPRD